MADVLDGKLARPQKSAGAGAGGDSGAGYDMPDMEFDEEGNVKAAASV